MILGPPQLLQQMLLFCFPLNGQRKVTISNLISNCAGHKGQPNKIILYHM